MDNELLRNASGYVDYTAYKAIKNYQEGEEKMEFKRGDICYYETHSGHFKVALVVSAEYRSDNYYQSIIVLTDEPKTEDSVPVVCKGMMYADCGMVSFAQADRLSEYIRTASTYEMAQVDECMAKNLGIERKTVKVPKDNVAVVESKLELAEVSEELTKAQAEANIYKDLYKQLLAKMLG
jgi:hypothetical protein